MMVTLTFADWSLICPSCLLTLSKLDTHQVVAFITEVFCIRPHFSGAMDYYTIPRRDQPLTSSTCHGKISGGG